MKVKLGFVTNSSSCAYCLWGVVITRDNITEEMKQKAWEEYDRGYNSTRSKPITREYFMEDYDCFNYIMEKLEDVLEIIYTDDGEKIVGMSPDKMKDNETLKDFKIRIVDEINKTGLIPKKDCVFWADQIEFCNGIIQC